MRYLGSDDLDASEAKSAAKSRLDRQQIMLEAAIQARDETAKQVAQIKAEQPRATVAYRDLVASPLPHLSGAHLMAANAAPTLS